MSITEQVLARRWYVPHAVYGAGANVYAGPDPNSAPFVCDCSAVLDLDLWDGDPYALADHIAAVHNTWLAAQEESHEPTP